MRETDNPLNDGDDTEPNRRRWHFGREIPVALILTMIGIFLTTLVSTIFGYSNTMNRLEKLETAVSQANAVPLALMGARISVLEASAAELKVRITDMERRVERRN